MKKLSISIIIMVLMLSGCSDKVEAKKAEDNKKTKTELIKPKKDNSIVLKDINGKTIKVEKIEGGLKFEGYENKIVVINFFATWCPPCKAEIPHLNNLQEKYKDDLSILSILLEEHKTNEQIIEFMNEYDIKFNVLNSEDNFALAQEVGGVNTIPFMIMYDKNGKYFQHYKGAVPEEMIDIDIQKVL